MLQLQTREDLLAAAGRDLGASPWMVIDQPRIDAFADATDDHSWIHVDVDRARRDSPGGKTIAHGFLSLSYMPRLLDSLVRVTASPHAFNYGIDRLRFPAPVPSDSRIRLCAKLESVAARPDGSVMVAYDCKIEVEGSDRPAVAGRWLAVYYF